MVVVEVEQGIILYDILCITTSFRHNNNIIRATRQVSFHTTHPFDRRNTANVSPRVISTPLRFLRSKIMLYRLVVLRANRYVYATGLYFITMYTYFPANWNFDLYLGIITIIRLFRLEVAKWLEYFIRAGKGTRYNILYEYTEWS